MKHFKFWCFKACNGDGWWEHVPFVGDWQRGRMYGFDIVNNMRNWVVGWTDWNLCKWLWSSPIFEYIFFNTGLDMQGGPNWAKNFVDAPILVNATADEIYKQPMFYFMAHFRLLNFNENLRVTQNWSEIILANLFLGVPFELTHTMLALEKLLTMSVRRQLETKFELNTLHL